MLGGRSTTRAANLPRADLHSIQLGELKSELEEARKEIEALKLQLKISEERCDLLYKSQEIYKKMAELLKNERA